LPRAPGRGEHFAAAHFPHAVPELVAIDSVAVSDRVPGCTIFGKRFPNLLNGPCRGGTLGNVEMNHPAPTVRQHHQHEKNPKGRRGHGEEVDGNEIANVVLQV